MCFLTGKKNKRWVDTVYSCACVFSSWVKSSDKGLLRDVGYGDRMRKTPNSNQSWAESPAQEHESLFPLRPCLYKRWYFGCTKLTQKARQTKDGLLSLLCRASKVSMVSDKYNFSFFFRVVCLRFVFPFGGCNNVSPAWPNLFYEEQFILLPLSSSHHRDRWRSWISKGSSDAHHVS